MRSKSDRHQTASAKQLPLMNFFGRTDDDDDDNVPNRDRDIESIFYDAHASGLPTCKLRRHY
jgi:hypothetical protein